MADACCIDVLEADGSLRTVAVAHADPAVDERLRIRYGAAADSVDESTIRGVLRVREPLMVRNPRTTFLSDGAAADDAGSMLRVPLVARDRCFGVMTLLTELAEEPFALSDVAPALELARSIAIAIENARLYRDACRAAAAREDLLAVVSHDLRNPLHIIALATQNLRRALTRHEDPQLPLLRQLDVVGKQIERMDGLIADLLDAASIEARRFPLKLAAEDVRSIINEAVEAMEPVASARRVRIERTLVHGPLPIHCDRGRVLQLLANLLGNAVKFSPAEALVVVRLTERAGSVEVSIADEGPGVRQAELPFLFDRYWQAKRADRSGTGLGLYIAKGIVDAHGGRIWAESTPGKGSRFSFSVPRNVA
jgi:signal transduction histidine kinase